MVEIFSAQAGRVTAIDGDVTPMLLEIGDDPEGVHPSSNWGGYEDFRAIITGFGVQQQGGFQFLHTLRDFVYVYVFGERVGNLTIEGLAFNADCESPSDDDILDEDGLDIPAQYHGLEWVQSYYTGNRITQRADPITVVLGLDTAFQAFLTSLRFEVMDAPNKPPFLGQFSMGFHVIPNPNGLGGDAVDDFDADEVLAAQLAFMLQLRREAAEGSQKSISVLSEVLGGGLINPFQ